MDFVKQHTEILSLDTGDSSYVNQLGLGAAPKDSECKQCSKMG